MPEYLAPGVFVEETSFRSKSIEGVATSTTGFVGLAHYGPVQFSGGPTATEPRLVTSYVEFERIYGRLDTLAVKGIADYVPYMAHAARAFFLNGGRRLYIARIFAADATNGVAEDTVTVTPVTTAFWRARWPGRAGNVAITCVAIRSGDVGLHTPGGPPHANIVQDGAVLEVVPSGAAMPTRTTAVDPTRLRVLRIAADGTQTFDKADGTPGPPVVTDLLLPVEVDVQVTVDAQRTDLYPRLNTNPAHRRYLGRILAQNDPEDEDSVAWFDDRALSNDPIALLLALVGTVEPPTTVKRLTGGNDGLLPDDDGFGGHTADPDHAELKATGLESLAEVDDVAIVALPDSGAIEDDDLRFLVVQRLIAHATVSSNYRIAVVDGPKGSSLNQIRAFRGNFDSSYAALYHPWIEILDPNGSTAPGSTRAKLSIPPSGFVCGIYANTDIRRGVFKAPANEVITGLTRFEVTINRARQEVLNPEHINALRFLEGRGNRVWGARTLSSDPEWLYVNVRRLFIFLEHSIDIATQWAVFEPNNEALWRNITRTVKGFLEVQWRNGALLGATPEQAFFVRCDRTTMTQNDLDNGRLICLIGVAPTKPAEFVIFRIGQWTADSET